MPRDVTSDIQAFSPADVREWLDAGQVVLVDVRETHEFEGEHIEGALLLPLSRLEPDKFPALPGQRVVVHCAIGKRSEAAAKMLIAAGHTHVAHMEGGLKAWKEQGFDTELPLDEPEAPAACLPAPHPGQVLLADYLAPRSLSPEALAGALGVDEARISDIVVGVGTMDSELSLRLARFFSTEPDFWMQLQLAHDLQAARDRLGAQIDQEIRPKAA